MEYPKTLVELAQENSLLALLQKHGYVERQYLTGVEVRLPTPKPYKWRLVAPGVWEAVA